MSDSKKSHISSKYLASICKSNPSFLAKLTISANYQKKTLHLVDAIILTVEYMQLYAQILLLNYYLYHNHSASSVQITEVLVPLAKVLLTGGLFKDESDKDTVLGLFLFLIVHSLLKIGLVIHVCYAAKNKTRLGRTIGKIWNWTFHFQARAIYSLIVSFWVILIQIALTNKLQLSYIFRYSLIVIPAGLMLFELLLSIIIEQSLSYNLPTKRFLSRKASFVETTTLLQKIMNQVFLIILVKLSDYPLSLGWITGVLNFGFCVIRDCYFFQNFPLYNIKALRYESCLLVLTTCQSLVSLVQTFLRQVYDENISMNFAIICWILLGILSVVLANKHIEKVFLELVTKPNNSINSNIMIHKVFAMQDYYKKHKLPGNSTQDYSFYYLVIQSLAGLEVEAVKDKNTEEYTKLMDKKFLEYFEHIVEKFPQNDLIKLILAWFHIKKMDSYGPGIRILSGLINSDDRSTAFNASLLIYELENGLLDNYRNGNSKLDLGEYTKSISAVINLKSLMAKQAQLQVKLCSGVSQTRPDLNEIFKSIQDIHHVKMKVEKKDQRTV